MGADGRLSTSKTVTMIWSGIVAFIVITLAFIANQEASTWFSDTINKAPDVYLVLLGGPFAAAVLAKIKVSTSIANGAIKTDGSGALNLVDLVTDDAGAADLYDFQYVLFNLVVILIVLMMFLPRPADGFPPLPDFLGLLTGGAALTYTANKWLNPITDSSPVISSLNPGHGKPNTLVTIYGNYLYSPNVSVPVQTQVRVGTAPATPPDLGSVAINYIKSAVPDPGPLQQSGGPDAASDPVDVTVVVNNGMSVTATAAWIYDPPVIDAITPDGETAGQQITLTGSGLSSSNAVGPTTVTFGGVPATIQGEPTADSVVVEVPPLALGVAALVDVVVVTNYGLKVTKPGGFRYQ